MLATSRPQRLNWRSRRVYPHRARPTDRDEIHETKAMNPGFTQRHPIGISRRELLQVGCSTLLGMGLPGLFAGRQRSVALGSPAAARPRSKSVILVFLGGAPSHIDTFDMKPEAPAEIRGEFRPIATRVPGIEFCEHMPKLAQVADRLAIVRTMTHGSPDHFVGTHMVLTGNNTLPPNVNPQGNLSRLDWPCYAAGVDVARPRSDGIPNGVTLPYPLIEQHLVWPGQHAGFLGARHDPWLLHHDPQDPGFRVPELQLSQGIDNRRLEERRSLLAGINQQRVELVRLAETKGLSSQQHEAFHMLTSGQIARAFSIDQEPAAVRDRYGRHTFGQSLLLARRLIEAGVPIVQANMGVAQTWDTHRDNFLRLKNKLLPPLDAGVSALIEDLAQRGLLEETLVVVMGEFGRTPRVGAERKENNILLNGRDHWGGVFFAVFAGGGVRGGQAIGRSDDIGAYPVTRGYLPADLGATIYAALGVDLATEIHDPLGRPLRLNHGTIIEPLFTASGE